MAVEIFSATGGSGSGFSINNFTGTQVQWNVPVTSFDIYMQGTDNIASFPYTYVSTTTQPDALYEITLAEMQAVGGWSTNLEGQIYVQFRAVGGGTLATTNVSIRDTTPINAANLDTYIERWWEREVKPELEAINTTLEAILEQMTPVVTEAEGNVMADQLAKIRAQMTPVTAEAQTETLADQLARIRYLADPNAAEVGSDNQHGTGIRTSPPYASIYLAFLFRDLLNGKIASGATSGIDEDTYNEQYNAINELDADAVNRILTKEETLVNDWVNKLQNRFPGFK